MNLEQLIAFGKSLGSPHPARDWMLALSLAVLVGFGVIGYAGYFYFGITTGNLIGAGSEVRPQPVSLTKGKLDQLIETYQTRLVDFEAGALPTFKVADPHKGGKR